MTRGGSTYYYQTNAHGDVVSLTDSTGTVVNSYRYDPWGKVVSSTETVSNPFRYAGYYYDSEVGLYYLWHRYRDPSLMRFLTKDTLAGSLTVPQSLNRYAYALNKPGRYWDPSGLKVGDYPSPMPGMDDDWITEPLPNSNNMYVTYDPDVPDVAWRADPESSQEWAHWQKMKRDSKGSFRDPGPKNQVRTPELMKKPTDYNKGRKDPHISDEDRGSQHGATLVASPQTRRATYDHSRSGPGGRG